MGGSAGSGVWDSCFGNSLSYAASDGVSGAGSSQTLSDVTLASNKEFSIWSSTECSGDSCGYYRPGSVAHHGFGGSAKIFAFEFSMPTDSDSSSSFNYDMPAVWLLNAQIPRNLQYGNSACSCWATGCGEMDLLRFSILGIIVSLLTFIVVKVLLLLLRRFVVMNFSLTLINVPLLLLVVVVVLPTIFLVLLRYNEGSCHFPRWFNHHCCFT